VRLNPRKLRPVVQVFQAWKPDLKHNSYNLQLKMNNGLLPDVLWIEAADLGDSPDL
jgi:hypothetical protein